MRSQTPATAASVIPSGGENCDPGNSGGNPGNAGDQNEQNNGQGGNGGNGGTSKGQITLPKQVRVELGVGPGDRIDFIRMEDGNFAVMPAIATIKALKGLIQKPKSPVSLEDMDKAIAQGARGRLRTYGFLSHLNPFAGYDGPEILPSSTPPICLMSPDGGQP